MMGRTMNPELVKALKAVRNGADPLTAYSEKRRLTGVEGMPL